MTWPLAQVRHCGRFAYGDSLAADARNDGDVAVYGSNGPVGCHDVPNTQGPVIVVGRKGSYGKLQYSEEPVFAIDTTYYIDQSTTDVDLRWFYYALSTARLDTVGQDVGVPGLNRDQAYSQRVPLPSREEQRAIADYLDTETARIDALITKKQRMVTLLDERIDSAVMGVVGRSDVVCASGAESLPIRRVIGKLDRPGSSGEMLTAFRDGRVTARSLRGRDGFTNSWTDGARVQGVEQGDVVVHGLDGFAGAIGDAEVAGVCSPVYHVCKVRDGGDPQFYGRLLRNLAISGYLGNYATSTRERAVDFRNWDLFGRIPVPRADVDEQRCIGEWIRELRPLRVLVDRSVELANERKRALVTAVVTGELRVPGVA